MSNFTLIGRKIIGIGRNYAKHALELGNAIPKTPMLFLKPTSSFVQQPHSIEIPKGCVVHHECIQIQIKVELGVVIGKAGRDIKAIDAHSYIKGYVLALDMTARNIQDEAKKSGHPWTVAKGYDTFTPVGKFIETSAVRDESNLLLNLKIDSVVKQHGSTNDMIFKIPTLIEYISKIMKLEDGDVILTGIESLMKGTPEGVGAVKAGQVLEGELRDGTTQVLISSITFLVIDRK